MLRLVRCSFPVTSDDAVISRKLGFFRVSCQDTLSIHSVCALQLPLADCPAGETVFRDFVIVTKDMSNTVLNVFVQAVIERLHVWRP